MKKNLVVGCLSILTVLSMANTFASESNFADVPKSHWANHSVERWAGENVIRGYEDETYQPENAITRVEFVTLLDRVFRFEKMADLSNFKDIDPNAWYYESLAKAYNMGLIKGYSDTEMGPNKPITRQEAMTIISRVMLANNMSTSSSYKAYNDGAQVADWARSAVSLLTDRGYANGYEDNTVRPNNNITRAETAKLLDRTFSIFISKPGTYDIDSAEGEVVVVSNDVVLEGKKFDRNIYVAPSVDLTTVKYDEKIAEQVIQLDEEKGTTVTPVVEDEKEEKTGGGGSSYSRLYIITVSEKNGIYEFTSSIKNKKLTKDDILRVDGLVTLDKSYIRTEKEAETAIREIMSQMEDDKIVATAKSYKGDPTVQELGLKVLGTLSTGEHIEVSGVDTMIEKTLAALGRDELIALANVVIK